MPKPNQALPQKLSSPIANGNSQVSDAGGGGVDAMQIDQFG
jgi:hypothetical protein